MQVVDAGEIGVDGTGTAWDHNDGWAYRVDGATPSDVFDVSEWLFSGVDALEGETTNENATTPYPIGRRCHTMGTP